MKEMSDKAAKAGTLLMISDGNYSSYQISGFFVVLSDFNPKALLEEFYPADPEPTKSFEPAEFLAFLLSKGFLLEIKYGELWCGDYHKARGDDGVHFWPISDERFT